MNYDMKKSGERIHQLRVRNGYTQETLAETLNIDRSFYGRVEAGKKGCSVDLLVQLAELFDVSLDYLVLGRYPGTLFKQKDKLQLQADINKLINHLEQFRGAL